MQAICPECLTPHKLKTSHDNRIRCKKCKTEFLAPVPAVAQNRLVQIRDEQKRLADSFRQEQKRLEEKYAGLNNQLDEAAQKIESESQVITASAEAKKVRDPIAKKLLKIVLSIYFAVVLVVTLGLMAYQYYQAESQIVADLKSSEKIFQKGLGDVLWNFDSGALRAIIAGMLEHPVIVGVKIVDDSGAEMGAGGLLRDKTGKYLFFEDKVAIEKDTPPRVIDAAEKGIADIFGHTFTIIYVSEEGEKTKVGEASVYSDTALILDRVKVGYWLLALNAVLVAIALLITLLWASGVYLGRPLSVLTHAVTELNLNHLDTLEVDVQTSERNELKILGEAYNGMVANLIEEKKRILQMSQTFEKFVPKQFMSRIADQGVSTIKLGGMESERLTILYCQIQSFDNLSEQMDPENMFQSLNAYMAAMEAPIEKHGGFIYQIQTHAIMALFDLNDRSMEALSSVYAAIDMHKALRAFNAAQKQNQYQPLSVRIGIHSGDVTFGTLGNETRLDPTLIGAAIDIAIRLQTAAADFNSQIVISEDTFNLLESHDAFQWRELDRITIEGQADPLRLFEVFDAETVVELKQQIRDAFHQGINLFRAEQWDAALQSFMQCLDIYPVDRVAHMYVKRCQNKMADESGIAAFLRNETKVFKALDDNALTQLAQRFKQLPFKQGETIIQIGDVGNTFYVISSGQMEVRINDSTCDDGKCIATLNRGECFGEMALMTGEPVRATVRGIAAGTLLTLQREEFQQMLREYPTLNAHFYKLFLKRLE